MIFCPLSFLVSLVFFDKTRVPLFLRIYFLLKMQNSADFNEQQAWGGSTYQSHTGPPSHTTLVNRQGTPLGTVPSHAGILASASDNFFHPTSFPVPSSLPYRLPDVPIPHHYPNYPYYSHIPMNRDYLSQPNNIPNSSSTSYNNPNFVIPPQQHISPVNSPILSPSYLHTPTQHHLPFLHPSPPPPPQHVPPFIHQSAAPPVQYVYYVPQTQPQPLPPSPPLPSFTKTLPSISHLHVPTLSNKADFAAWDEGVTSSLRAHGLLGHILAPSTPLDSTRPDRTSCPMPILPLSPTAADLASLTHWWDEDNIVQHILTSRLGTIPRGLLPSSILVARTAFSIYQTLVRYYGTSNFADCTELFDSLNALLCQPGHVQEYVSRWRTGISRLQSAKFPFSIKVSISHFIRGLPLTPAFFLLRSQLPMYVAAAGDQDYGAFVTITESALEQETVFRSASQHVRPPHHLSSLPNPSAESMNRPIVTPSVPDRSMKPAPNAHLHAPGSSKTCTNCGLTGHLASTCFKPGGGMAGQRDEFKRNRNQVVAMMIASLDEAYGVADMDSPEDISSPISPHIPPNDNPVVTPVSPILSAQNEYVHHDVYPMHDSRASHAFSSSSAVDHMAFFMLKD